jgi:hypothetical protein
VEKSVEVGAIILFGGIGLSHILQPKAWVKFYTLLRDNQEAGAILDGILHLPMTGVSSDQEGISLRMAYQMTTMATTAAMNPGSVGNGMR